MNDDLEMIKSLEIYNYLVLNCIGYENRKKSTQLMELFNIRDNKTFRAYVEKARQNPDLEYFLASEAGKKGGYWIATNEQEKGNSL